MSLLNQVLQDLEKRNANDSSIQNQSAEIKVTPARQQLSIHILLIFFCIAVLIIFIAFEFIYKTHTPIDNQQPSPLSKISKVLVKKTITKPTESKKTAITHPPKTIPVSLASEKPKTKKTSHSETKDKQKTVNVDQQTQSKIAVKSISNKQKAEQLFASIKQENKIDSQSTLRLILQLNPEQLRARLLLVNTLLKQGLIQETSTLLDQGLIIFPQNLSLIIIRSQLYLQAKQAEKALTILHQVYPEQNQDETYLSLLASAYQQHKENLKSLETYQKLISINPQQAKYWLGLAVAWEKQGDKSQALHAYQQALNKGTLKPTIVSYIKQRLTALN